jgi:hypothetical protein
MFPPPPWAEARSGVCRPLLLLGVHERPAEALDTLGGAVLVGDHLAEHALRQEGLGFTSWHVGQAFQLGAYALRCSSKCGIGRRSSRASGPGTHSGDRSDRPGPRWCGCHWLAGPSGFVEHRLPATADERRAHDGVRLAGALPGHVPFASCLQAFPSLSLGPRGRKRVRTPERSNQMGSRHRAGDHSRGRRAPAPQSKPSRPVSRLLAQGRAVAGIGLGLSLLAVGPVRDRPYSHRGRLCATTSTS